MTTIEVAQQLVALCKAGRFHDATTDLYADDVVSVEASTPDGSDPVSRGKAAVLGKGEWWRDNHDVHGFAVNGPWPHGDRFIVNFEFDVTFKPTGQRIPLSEVALYEVSDGKIVREEFFYAAGP